MSRPEKSPDVPSGTERRSPRWPRRLTRIGLPVAALLLACVYAGRDALIGPLVIREIQRVAAGDLGLQVHVGSASGDYLREFVLHDVSIGPASALGLQRAAVARITIRYSLPELLLGTPGALRLVNVTGADIAFDLDALDPRASNTPRLVLDDLPEFVLDDARLSLVRGHDTLELDGLALRLPAGALAPMAADSVEVTAGRTVLRASLPDLAGRAGTLDPSGAGGDDGQATALLHMPSWDAVVHRAGDLLELRDLVSEGTRRLDRATVDLQAARAGRLLLEVEVPLAQGHARVRYASGDDHDRIDLALHSAEVSALRDLAATLGLAADGLPTTGLVDIETALDVRRAPAFEVTGTLAVELHDLDWEWIRAGNDPAGHPRAALVVDDVGLDATLEPEALVLARCEVAGPALRADLAGTTLRWSPTPSLDLAATGELLGGVFPEGHLLTVDAHATPGDDGSWRVSTLAAASEGMRLRLTGLSVRPSPSDPGATLEHARLELDVDQTTADLHGLALDWDPVSETATAALDGGRVGARGHDLTLVAPARLTWSDGRQLHVESLELAGARGEVSLRGRIDVRDTDADFHLTARDLRSNGLLRAWLPGLPGFDQIERLDVDVSGPPDALTTTVSLRVLGVDGPRLPPVDVELDAVHDRDSLRVDRLEISAQGRLLASGTARMALIDGWPDAAAGAVNADIAWSLPSAHVPLGDVSLEAPLLGGRLTVSGDWPCPQARITLHAQALELSGVALPEGARWPAFDAEARLVDGTLTLDDVILDTGPVRVVAGGRCEDLLHLGRDDDGWPTTSVDGGASLQGRVEVSGREGALLVAAVPGVRRAAGHLDAELRLAGTLESPRLAGPVSLAGGELAIAALGVASLTQLEGLAWLQAPLELAGTAPSAEIALSEIRLSGELGAVPFDVEGEMTLTTPAVDSAVVGLDVDLVLDGRELLLYRAGGVKLRADTHLRLHGPWHAMVLGGSVAITDGRVSRHMSLLDLAGEDVPLSVRLDRVAVTEPPWSAVELDVALTTVNPIQVRSQLIRADARLDARLLGVGADPRLDGNLIVDRGLIPLHLWDFRLDRAFVQFDPRDLLRSELSGTARSRMLGYDVLAVLSGPLEVPELRLSSLPPMAEEDLLDLVLAGRLPDDGAFDENSRVLSGVAVYLGRDLLSRTLGDESTESTESLLSRFELESGRNRSRTGSETFDARFRMFDNVFTDDDSVYIEVEQSEFDETNGSLRFVFRLK